MTNTQDVNKKAEAEGKDAAQNQVSQISSAPEKDALGDKSLDDVSGGGWPYATMGTAQVSPTI